MRVLAIILNYKTAALTERAIVAALAALDAVPGSSLVVVDNDSQDGSFERLAAFADGPAMRGRFELVQSGRNGGFGAGNNVAIRRALASSESPDYLYILNSDAFPEPDAIRALVDHLDAHPEIGLAGSSIHGLDDRPHETAFRFPSIASELETAMQLGVVTTLLASMRVPRPMPTATEVVDWVAGASLIVRRQVFETVGLFDETFFLYFEETELCHRAAQAGFRTAYVVESRVAHVGSASTGVQGIRGPMPTYWFDSRAHYFAKTHGGAYLFGANAARILGGVSLRTRALLQRRQLNEPHHFLRDLTVHAIRRRMRVRGAPESHETRTASR